MMVIPTFCNFFNYFTLFDTIFFKYLLKEKQTFLLLQVERITDTAAAAAAPSLKDQQSNLDVSNKQ
jgi:hypothetical protein